MKFCASWPMSGLVVLLTVFGISPLAAQSVMSRAEVRARTAELTALGAALFRDPHLSASGRVSCASCHDPVHGFGPPDARPVQPGGVDMARTSFRAPPSLTYLQDVPAFSEHEFESEDELDESVDNGPTGGLTWDGRVDRTAVQARIPLLSPDEMANPNETAVEKALAAFGHGPTLDRLALKGESRFAVALEALEAYQQEAKTFYPFTSRYDGWLAGKEKLTPQELHGLALFEDPAKGNCSSCHVSAPGRDGSPPRFTDYGLIALAVPRNRQIAANHDSAFHDLGLCGPLRTDFRDRAEYCGLFRTPSLRNVAQRKVFFHNGVVHDLREAVAFYVTRDSDPGRWYARGPHGVTLYDDLPRCYWPNINMDPPFGRKTPALSDDEIDAVVAFLRTLTDR
ncbi:cytochrome-c peroxidase [Acetobacter estunensis]|uniref:cytochrome-c peroxidase n=1 Tax=Acetobacter estunensis TaxID=104097 RepID=UPI001C2D880A|nr:cytochrome c peroxidase [Acetobacter estunensis]MBV1838012.1 methylamine utilization protein MauG [Acetobacter estunensis]